MKLPSVRILLRGATLLGLVSFPARAATPNAVEPPADEPGHFTIGAGAFLLSSIKTTLSLSDSNGQLGDDLDFVTDLGGKKSLTVFRADGEWRFARRHKVEFSYYDINLTATHDLTADIEWGDEIFPVSATVDSQFRTTVYRLNYGYTFYRNHGHEVAGLIGAHVTRFAAGLSAPNLGRSEAVGVTAPLPVFGLEWNAQLSNQLTSRVSYTYFGISIDSKYSGNLSDFLAKLDYRFADNWSVGAGYNRYTLHASVEARNLELSMKHSYNGLMVFLSASF